jgi:chromosome segregation ATPase
MEKRLSYEERMKERRKIISEIDATLLKIKDLNIKMDGKKNEIENLREKMKTVEKEIEAFKKEKSDLEREINDLKEKHMKIGIPVPEGKSEGYEISKGLLGMKRDINIKTTEYLNDEKTKQVYLFYFFFLFICVILF